MCVASGSRCFIARGRAALRTIPNGCGGRKSNVVAHFLRSSYAVGLELRQKKTDLLEKHGLPFSDYAAHGGSFPIHAKHAGVIGSVTVSGLPQRDDHELVVEALCVEARQDYAAFQLPPQDW